MLEKIIHYYKPYKLILLLVLIGSCFSALMELVFPYIVRQMLNVEIPQKNLDELFLLGRHTGSIVSYQLWTAFRN